MLKNNLCPCCSGEIYDRCCKPFHEGKLPENALQLMRSRYSAYALNLPDYIIETTHKNNHQYIKDKELWKKQISVFSKSSFSGLDIVDFQEDGDTATVTFTAHISQDDKDVSFTEKSFFKKVDGRWLYKSGQIISPI